MLEVCQSGKSRTKWEYTEVNAVICRYMCPDPTSGFIKEQFLRKWSNATQWPNGVVPQAGDNVTLNGNWTVLLDVDPNPLDYFIIDGTLLADDTRDVNITANSIFIRAGNLSAGVSIKPFVHKFTLQINGRLDPQVLPELAKIRKLQQLILKESSLEESAIASFSETRPDVSVQTE